MPAAIPLIVGYLATEVAVGLALVAAGSIGATLIGAGASIITPMVGRAVAPE